MRILLASLLILNMISFNAFAEKRSANVESFSFHNSIEKATASVVSLYAIKAKSEDNALGSGVIVKKNGIIITNRHIVEGAQSIKIVTAGNKTYLAKTLNIDYDLDLAILQIIKTKDKFKAIKFADSDNLFVGDRVFALGNPFGIGQSVSMGIVSATGRAFNAENSGQLIQVDAAINPGNSGGALIDVDGKLVGMNSAIFSETDGFSGVGFAVPANAVRYVLNSVSKTGKIQKAWLGIKGQNISKQLQRSLGLKSNKGVYINHISAKSSAEKAEIKIGDVLVKLGKYNIINQKSLSIAQATLKPKQRVTAKIIRNNRIMELELIPQVIEKRSKISKVMIRGNNKLSGLVVETLSPELNFMFNLTPNTKGIAVVDCPAYLAEFNLQVGDVILQVNKTIIKQMNDLKDVLNSPAPYGLKLTVLRSGREIKLFIK